MDHAPRRWVFYLKCPFFELIARGEKDIEIRWHRTMDLESIQTGDILELRAGNEEVIEATVVESRAYATADELLQKESLPRIGGPHIAYSAARTALTTYCAQKPPEKRIYVIEFKKNVL